MTAKCNLFFQFILIFKTNLWLTEFHSFFRNKFIETISRVHHVYKLFVTLLCPTFLTLIVLPFSGQNLIEDEKMAIGGVKMAIYYYYIKSVGFLMAFATVVLYLGFTGFSVGSSIWLSAW